MKGKVGVTELVPFLFGLLWPMSLVQFDNYELGSIWISAFASYYLGKLFPLSENSVSEVFQGNFHIYGISLSWRFVFFISPPL